MDSHTFNIHLSLKLTQWREHIIEIENVDTFYVVALFLVCLLSLVIVCHPPMKQTHAQYWTLRDKNLSLMEFEFKNKSSDVNFCILLLFFLLFVAKHTLNKHIYRHKDTHSLNKPTNYWILITKNINIMLVDKFGGDTWNFP